MDVGPLIDTPVTGRETGRDPKRPENALAEFYRALNDRDMALMAANWDDGDAAAMDNPLGGIVRGWGSIAEVYGRLFAAEASYRFVFHDYRLSRTDEMFFVVGRERGVLEGAAGKLDLAVRTTRLFVRRPERWRQIHHHGSIDDAGMLARYQEAVRGQSKAAN